MPRITRSKAKAAVHIHEDEPEEQHEQTETELGEDSIDNARLPLSELGFLNLEDIVKAPAVEDVSVALEALRKPKPKARKAKGGRKTKKPGSDKESQGEDQGMVMNEEAAVRETCKRLDEKTVDGDIELIDESASRASKSNSSTDDIDDSFAVTILSRSPAKFCAESQKVGEPQSQPSSPAKTEDSFIEQIISRTPIKRVSRVEDSVDAIDALEEALEEAQEAVKEPLMDKRKSEQQPPSSRPNPRASSSLIVSKTRGQSSRQKPTTSRVQSSTTAVKRPAARAVTAAQQKPSLGPASVTVPATKKRVSTISHSPAPTGATQRRKATQPTPRRPSHSTAPPKTTFSLPGEAVAARLKAVREAREAARAQRAQEAGREALLLDKPKPKPVKRGIAPAAPISTTTTAGTATKKTQTSIQGTAVRGGAGGRRASGIIASIKAPKLAVRPTKTSIARISSISGQQDSLSGAAAAVVVKKRTSSLNGGLSTTTRRPSTTTQHTKSPPSTAPQPAIPAAIAANTSIKRAAAPAAPPSSSSTATQRRKPSVLSDSTLPHRRTTSTSVTIPRERRSVSVAEQVAAQRAREEAARRARAEAAERGRLASQAWAEKMMGRRKEKGGVAKGMMGGRKVVEAGEA